MSSVTTDAFLGGAIEVLQPAKGGHRAGLDALLLASSMPLKQTGCVADFGAGCGIVGLVAAQLNSEVTVDLVEYEPQMANLARQTLDLPGNSRISERMRLIEADLTKNTTLRREGGLHENAYDLILTNPPFNDAGRRPSPNPQRRMAHDLNSDILNQWVRTSAACLKGRGKLHMILRPSNLPTLLAACEGRFGAIRILPIHAKHQKSANRMIVAAVKGAKGELQILPSFIVHEPDGKFTAMAEDIFHGRARLLVE